MAKNKYYAVKAGIKVGIFRTWEEFSNHVIAYIDGSYNQELNKYSYGVVFIAPNGLGCDPEYISNRNIAGELMGAKKQYHGWRKMSMINCLFATIILEL